MKQYKVDVYLDSMAKVTFDVESESAANADRAVRAHLINPEAQGVQVMVREGNEVQLMGTGSTSRGKEIW